jgi:hypothetical protein
MKSEAQFWREKQCALPGFEYFMKYITYSGADSIVQQVYMFLSMFEVYSKKRLV